MRGRSPASYCASSSAPRLAAHAALYHAGRAATYVTLGAAVGVAGSTLARLGFGRVLAVVAGVVLVGQALMASGTLSSLLPFVPVASAITHALGRAVDVLAVAAPRDEHVEPASRAQPEEADPLAIEGLGEVIEDVAQEPPVGPFFAQPLEEGAEGEGRC